MKLYKYISPLLFVAFTLWASYTAMYLISEKYYFDKVFYDKSPDHGYTAYEWNVINQVNSPIIEARIADLRTLVDKETVQKNNVLGDSDDSSYYKIALIGDSWVYGLGIRQNQTLGKILEQKLSKIYPTKVYILASPGDSIINNYSKFILAKKYLHPNLYIIGLINNDLDPGSFDKYPGGIEFYNQLQKDCPGNELDYHYNLQNDYRQLMDLYYLPSLSEEYTNLCYFDVSIKNIVASSKNVLFYSFSVNPDDPISNTSNLSDSEKETYMIKKFETIINKYGGVVKSTANISMKYTPVSQTEGHPSAETHQLYADSLFKWIIQMPQYKFPTSH